MKLFITGISGLLGLNLALQARERFQVGGCYYTHAVAVDGVQPVKVDVTSFTALEEALRTYRPDVVVHAAGLTNVEECEGNPIQAYRIHVEATQYVAEITGALGARLVHISTDHLFDGTRPWKTETDSPDPPNTYAKSKWGAEEVVGKICPDALIIRTNFFGWGTPVRVSFSDWILQGLAKGQELRMFSDVFFTPILINDLVDAMLELMVRGATGIFHVAGSDRLSKYAFAVQVAEVFDYPRDKIHEISVEDFPFRAKRPKDMSLSSEKAARILRSQLPGVKDGLYRLKKLQSEGHCAALKRAIVSDVAPEAGVWRGRK